MSAAPDVIGIVVCDPESVASVGASYYPLQVATIAGDATVYLPPSPSKLAAGTPRGISVVLAPRIQAKPLAAVEALRIQGVTRVIMLHPVDLLSRCQSISTQIGDVTPELALCIADLRDVLRDHGVNRDVAPDHSDSLRRDIARIFLVEDTKVPCEKMEEMPSTAILESKQSISAGIETCVLCFACDRRKYAVADIESRVVDTLVRGLVSPFAVDQHARGGSFDSNKASSGMLGFGTSSQTVSSLDTLQNPGSSLGTVDADVPFAEPPKQTVDLVIAARWVLPMEPDEHTLLQRHTVVVDEGKILDILPTDDALAKYAPRSRINRPSHVAMPGLINAHTHSGMTLMRGCADDQTLLTWLRETVWPVEMAFISSDSFCEDGAMLAVAEMLRGGITTFADMYWYPEAAARVAIQTGIRAVLGMIVIAFPSAYAASADEYIEKGHQLRERHSNDSNLHFAYAPHAPYTVSDEIWEKLRDLSLANGLPIHTHLHETSDECTASAALDRENPACHQSEHAVRPLENFRRMGLLSPRLMGAHMTQLTAEEIALCAEHRVNVVNCPTSNAKLASGFCPVPELLAAGVNVAIGTDSAASNNSLDMFAEMKLSALLAKNLSGDATVVPATTALRLGTINAATALGIENVTGSLTTGKAADIICVELETHSGNAPMFDVHSALVYAASRHDVTDVFVEGQHLLREKTLLRIDEESLVLKVKGWSSRIMSKFPQVGSRKTNEGFPPADKAREFA